MKQFRYVLSAVLALCLQAPTYAQMRTQENDSVIKEESLKADVVVVGGGIAGICAAVEAARNGAGVILVQDRPMLGGNASSEIRMGVCGVYGDKYYETGILEELQIKNSYYNPLQRYTLWDDVFYSTVREEENITLLLNTSVNEVKTEGNKIIAVKAWNSDAYKTYTLEGEIFIDCTGDGILRLSGAEYRIGRESSSEYGESYAQENEDAMTMGNSILMQLRKTDTHVPYTAPSWAYHFTDEDFDCEQLPPTEAGVKYKYKKPYNLGTNNFWWIEFGGDMDVIGDANEIQFELKRIAYGMWEYLKNHPDGRGHGYELDWIGAIPGKRESVRYVGGHVLTQQDVLSGGHFDDVIAYGGWGIDDHVPGSFFTDGVIALEYPTPEVFGIPFGCLYSVNIENLMFAGRDISATHIAFSASRVMATCALLGQAAGAGAAVAVREGETPREVHTRHISEVQTMLEDDDCLLPYRFRTPSALTLAAELSEENEVLRNGVDRRWDEADNGVWVAPEDKSIEYVWPQKVTLGGARLVFDTNLKWRSKRMRKLEATTERLAMPDMLVRSFRLEARVDGRWQTVFRDENNFLRLRKIEFTPVDADALRLVVESTWGGEKAHIFALDAE